MTVSAKRSATLAASLTASRSARRRAAKEPPIVTTASTTTMPRASWATIRRTWRGASAATSSAGVAIVRQLTSSAPSAPGVTGQPTPRRGGSPGSLSLRTGPQSSDPCPPDPPSSEPPWWPLSSPPEWWPPSSPEPPWPLPLEPDVRPDPSCPSPDEPLLVEPGPELSSPPRSPPWSSPTSWLGPSSAPPRPVLPWPLLSVLSSRRCRRGRRRGRHRRRGWARRPRRGDRGRRRRRGWACAGSGSAWAVESSVETCAGTRTGTDWENDALPVSPSTAGISATPMPAT